MVMTRHGSSKIKGFISHVTFFVVCAQQEMNVIISRTSLVHSSIHPSFALGRDSHSHRVAQIPHFFPYTFSFCISSFLYFIFVVFVLVHYYLKNTDHGQQHSGASARRRCQLQHRGCTSARNGPESRNTFFISCDCCNNVSDGCYHHTTNNKGNHNGILHRTSSCQAIANASAALPICSGFRVSLHRWISIHLVVWPCLSPFRRCRRCFSRCTSVAKGTGFTTRDSRTETPACSGHCHQGASDPAYFPGLWRNP